MEPPDGQAGLRGRSGRVGYHGPGPAGGPTTGPGSGPAGGWGPALDHRRRQPRSSSRRLVGCDRPGPHHHRLIRFSTRQAPTGHLIDALDQAIHPGTATPPPRTRPVNWPAAPSPPAPTPCARARLRDGRRLVRAP
ncbi:hypothetical protein E4K10_42630 [Streptomyces sp. T1317-0309]|nr:hypothetical protein E4K10_42630 [Streptomyces sp. T1317-0309]